MTLISNFHPTRVSGVMARKGGWFGAGTEGDLKFIMMPRRLDLTFCGVWNCIIVGAALWMDFVVLLDTFSLRVHQSCFPTFLK